VTPVPGMDRPFSDGIMTQGKVCPWHRPAREGGDKRGGPTVRGELSSCIRAKSPRRSNCLYKVKTNEGEA
jgi:hypothetical protein